MERYRKDFDNLIIEDYILENIIKDLIDYYYEDDCGICSGCGEYIEEEWNYCPECGMDLSINNRPNQFNSALHKARDYIINKLEKHYLPKEISERIPSGWDELRLCFDYKWNQDLIDRINYIISNMEKTSYRK